MSALTTEQIGLIQPHFGWLLSMKQIGQRLARIGRTHKGLAHQEGIHMRLTHFLDICRGQNATFCDQDSVGGHIFQHAQGGVQADFKGSKVAVVDAH
jgi:hypothetical protein